MTNLHVAQVGFHLDTQGREPARLLQDWPTLVDIAEAAQGAGIRVSVVQACSRTGYIIRNAVSYHFFAVDPLAGVGAHSGELESLIRHLQPDVLHVHGLCFPADVALLAQIAPGVPILLQDHASQPPRIWRRRSWRRGMSVAAGIAFCCLEQARPFAKAGLVHPDTQVYAIPESTSRFTPGDKEQARHSIRVSGDPLVLWVGHLNENKDPLTVLDGISEAARTLPDLQLWCCFGVAPLLRKVRKRIAADSALRQRVHLLGRVSHEQVEQLMRAADVFALGSHQEGSGYSLIEALACGLPPVVTDIPSFRSLTAAGTVGKLWPCGDSHAFCEALRSIARRIDSGMRAGVREHFERELSFDALGSKLAVMYEDVFERKHGNAGSVAAALPTPWVRS